MQIIKKHSLCLPLAARYLAGSHFAWVALPSISHSDGYAFQTRAGPANAISHPKFRTLVHYVG